MVRLAVICLVMQPLSCRRLGLVGDAASAVCTPNISNPVPKMAE